VTDPIRFCNRFFLSTLVLSAAAFLVQAQDAKPQSAQAPTAQQQDGGAQKQGQADDPLSRPRKPKPNPAEGKFYKRWLDEDVRWIITSEEEQAFKKLSTNAERDQFIETFWQRRDPTPDTEENEYKEEHYRRIAYSNEHFAAGVPGWRTDRGRMYIMYGKPDSIDSHPAGGPYQRSAEEGGGQTETFPFEVWRYRYLDNIGQEVEIEFVDPCGCGEYHMTLDRSEKDALLHVPNAGLTDMEAMGMANKADRFRGGLESLGQGFFNSDLQTKQFDRLEQFAKLNAPPPVKFKDLEEVVNTKIRYNLLPFDVQVDYAKVTSDTVLVPITIQIPNRELTYVNKEGVQRASLNIFGRLTTLTGKVAQTFEDSLRLDQPVELFEKFIGSTSVYQKALPIHPGRYRLDIVLKDVNGDKVGSIGQGIQVPDFSGDDKLATSTLILADVLEPVPTREIGTGSFVIGTNRVRPKVHPANGKPTAFKHDQKVNLWMQVYNLSVDDKTKKPSATVEYQVVNTATNKEVVNLTENTEQMGNVGDQLTLAKSLPPNKLDPGVYQVTIKINDLISKQTISPTTKFQVE